RAARARVLQLVAPAAVLGEDLLALGGRRLGTAAARGPLRRRGARGRRRLGGRRGGVRRAAPSPAAAGQHEGARRECRAESEHDGNTTPGPGGELTPAEAAR